MKQSLTYIALIALLLAGIFIGRSSAGSDDTELVKAQKHVADSLGHVLDSTKQADDLYIDQIYADNLAMDSIIKVYDAERERLKTRIVAISGMSDHYAELYLEAQTAKDTSAMVQNCDSLVHVIAEMQVTDDAEINVADSIIEAQHNQNVELKAGMQRLQLDNGKLYASGKQLQGLYNDLNARYRKKTNWWHRWGLPAVAGIAGVLGTHFLIK